MSTKMQLAAVRAAPLRVLEFPRHALAVLAVAHLEPIPVLPGIEGGFDQPIGFIGDLDAGRFQLVRLEIQAL